MAKPLECPRCKAPIVVEDRTATSITCGACLATFKIKHKPAAAAAEMPAAATGVPTSSAPPSQPPAQHVALPAIIPEEDGDIFGVESAAPIVLPPRIQSAVQPGTQTRSGAGPLPSSPLPGTSQPAPRKAATKHKMPPQLENDETVSRQVRPRRGLPAWAVFAGVGVSLFAVLTAIVLGVMTIIGGGSHNQAAGDNPQEGTTAGGTTGSDAADNYPTSAGTTAAAPGGQGVVESLPAGQTPNPLAPAAADEFFPAPALDAAHAPRLRPIAPYMAAPDPDKAPEPPPPIDWQPIPPDLRPEPQEEIQFAKAVTIHGAVAMSVMADRDGPFAIHIADWVAYPNEDTAPIQYEYKNAMAIPYERKDAWHLLVDMRTQEVVGKYHWRANVHMKSRLSPDGKTLVTLATKTEVTGLEFDNPPSDHCLAIFHPDNKKIKFVEMPAGIDWMEFVDNETLAMAVYKPERAVQLWNTKTGQLTGEVLLTQPHFSVQDLTFNAVGGPGFYQLTDVTAFTAALSPGGKYMAVAGKLGITLVSLADLRELGTLSWPTPVDKSTSVTALNFSADGTTLYAVELTYASVVCAWSLETGLITTNVLCKDEPILSGPVFAGPIESTLIFGSSRQLGHWGDGTSMLPKGTGQVINGTCVVETLTGSVVERYAFSTLRMGSNGTVLAVSHLAYAPAEAELPETVQMPVDPAWTADELQQKRQEFRDGFSHGLMGLYRDTLRDAAETRAATQTLFAQLADRPQVSAGDRTQMKSLIPEPPATWSALPVVAYAPVPLDETDDYATRHHYGDWPSAFADKEAAILRYKFQRTPRYRNEIFWDRVDRVTGKRLAPGIPLWPWAILPGIVTPSSIDTRGPQRAPEFKAPAALRPDGQQLLLGDLVNPHRLDCWSASGERLSGFIPYAEGTQVDWVAWPQAKLVLTLGAGKLTAWNPENWSAVYEISGNYGLPIDQKLNQSWMAVPSGPHIDLLEIATGNCLGRLHISGATGELRGLAVSQDGAFVAAAYSGWTATQDPAKGHTAIIWDTATGNARLIPFGTPNSEFRDVTFMSPEHLLLGTADGHLLVDLKLNTLAAQYNGLDDRGFSWPLMQSRDGRVWFATTDIPQDAANVVFIDPQEDFPASICWRELRLPGLNAGETYLSNPGRVYLNPKSLPVRVVANFGNQAQSQTHAALVAQHIHTMGYAIGPGGWTLVADWEPRETGQLVTFPLGGDAKVPGGTVHYRLVNGEGLELLKTKAMVDFNPSGSKYMVSRSSGNEVKLPGDAFTVVYTLDFKGADPVQAMLEEMFDQNSASLVTRWELPQTTYILSGGKPYLSGTRGRYQLKAKP